MLVHSSDVGIYIWIGTAARPIHCVLVLPTLPVLAPALLRVPVVSQASPPELPVDHVALATWVPVDPGLSPVGSSIGL